MIFATVLVILSMMPLNVLAEQVRFYWLWTDEESIIHIEDRKPLGIEAVKIPERSMTPGQQDDRHQALERLYRHYEAKDEREEIEREHDAARRDREKRYEKTDAKAEQVDLDLARKKLESLLRGEEQWKHQSNNAGPENLRILFEESQSRRQAPVISELIGRH